MCSGVGGLHIQPPQNDVMNLLKLSWLADIFNNNVNY